MSLGPHSGGFLPILKGKGPATPTTKPMTRYRSAITRRSNSMSSCPTGKLIPNNTASLLDLSSIVPPPTTATKKKVVKIYRENSLPIDFKVVPQPVFRYSHDSGVTSVLSKLDLMEDTSDEGESTGLSASNGLSKNDKQNEFLPVPPPTPRNSEASKTRDASKTSNISETSDTSKSETIGASKTVKVAKVQDMNKSFEVLQASNDSEIGGSQIVDNFDISEASKGLGLGNSESSRMSKTSKHKHLNGSNISKTKGETKSLEPISPRNMTTDQVQSSDSESKWTLRVEVPLANDSNVSASDNAVAMETTDEIEAIQDCNDPDTQPNVKPSVDSEPPNKKHFEISNHTLITPLPPRVKPQNGVSPIKKKIVRKKSADSQKPKQANPPADIQALENSTDIPSESDCTSADPETDSTLDSSSKATDIVKSVRFTEQPPKIKEYYPWEPPQNSIVYHETKPLPRKQSAKPSPVFRP